MKKVFIIGIILSFFWVNISFAKREKQILIINSYDPTYRWTHDIVEALCNNLQDYILYIEYMDTKRFERQSIFKIFVPYLNDKYRNIKLDLIIVTDNNALDFLVKNREKLVFKKVPVVFCGINEFRYDMLGGYKDITGVVEDINIKMAIRFMLTLQPSLQKIYVILDNTYSNQLYLKDVLDVKRLYEKEGKLSIEIINGRLLGLKEFTHELEKIKGKSAILLFTLLKLKDGTIFSYREGIKYIYKHTHKPIYEVVALSSFVPGVVAGVTSSALLQGRYAAHFARQILDVGIPPDSLPVLMESPSMEIVNYRALKKFHIDEKRIPPGVKVINRPSPILHVVKYQKRKIYILEILTASLLLFILLFLINYKKRRKLQGELMDKNLQFNALINGSNDIICLKDGHGRWLIANESDIKLFNLTNVDYRGKTDEELATLVPHYREALLFCTKTDEQAWEARKPIRSMETIVQEDGKRLIFDIIKTPIFDNLGRRKYLIVIGRDITEYKELEEQLVHSQKMELLGKIAGGIAHDFNNILAGLLMNAEMLRLKLLQDKELIRYIENIIQGLDSASDLVKKIKLMSRKEEVQLRPIDFNDVLQRTLSLVTPSIPLNISLDIDMDASLPYIIMGDVNQLTQVVMNLVLNARDAIVEARREKGVIRIELQRQGRELVVKIRDNGAGIREEDRERIFDPFFTTKENIQDRGTGLGLSISKSIIEKHNGRLWFHSREGVGTEFVFTLSLVEEEFSGCQEGGGVELHSALRGKTVLIVDDEEDILNILKEMLLLMELKVVTQRNGKDALQYLSQHREEVDVVLIDWMMPVMNGRDTILSMKEKGIEIPVVIVSGYIDREILEFKARGLVKEVISKPFKFEKIIRKLNKTVN